MFKKKTVRFHTSTEAVSFREHMTQSTQVSRHIYSRRDTRTLLQRDV